MKKIIQFLLTGAIAFFIAGVYTACNSKDETSNPHIDYIRVTNPNSSDSLLISAGQGSLIAIIGDDLKDVVKILFNDQQSTLTPTYISNTSILVSVPTKLPTQITNKMTLVFSNGDVLYHDFEVSIHEPVLNTMECEYVADGDYAIIHGDYFYPPLTVEFPGNVTATPDSVGDQIMKVKVPSGALPGQITIKSLFGEGKSNFWFRDNRNIVISSDPFTGWWNQSFVVTNPSDTDPEAINGNYIRVKKAISGWNWLEVAGGPASAMGDISKNIPDEAILKPYLYNLKFEVNTRKPYNSNVIKLNFGLQSENNDAYLWLPPYDTKGKWQTVIIPFDDMAKAYEAAGSKMQVNHDGYWTRVLFHGPGDLDCDMSFDNFRIVPKTIDNN